MNTKRILYPLVLLLIVLVIVEGSLHITAFLVQSGNEEQKGDKRYTLPHFSGHEWGRDLFAEMDELSGDYKEFRGWGKKAYSGRYVNIDSNGKRRTWNREEGVTDQTKDIYMFGASRIWGDSARDEYTIPSYVSKVLNEKGHDFRVHNYGEWSYTYTQSLVYLIMLLRDGHRPDYVILYEGTDAYVAYQAGKTGTLHYSFLFRERGKDLTDLQHVRVGLTSLINNNFLIYKQLKKIQSKFKPKQPMFTEVGHGLDDSQLRSLAGDIADHLEGTHDLLDKLSKAYGFEYLMFWPPLIFTEDKLFPEEVNLEPRQKDEKLAALYRYADEKMKTGIFPHFYNISDVFSKREEPFYLDTAHTTEKGNELAADKIVSLFEKEYLLNE